MTLQVVLCGDNNAVHVLASYVSALPDCTASVLLLNADEAGRLAQAIPDEGICCVNDLGPDKYGKPVAVSDDPATAAGADVVILALPSYFHELYLKQLQPHLKKGVVLGAMPGEGGFDVCCRNILGTDFVQESSLFALETLPWACRVVEYGKSVKILGTKKKIDVAITPPAGTTMDAPLLVLQKLVGPLPVMVPACNFLAITLMNINSVWHPTISYGFYRNKDKLVFDEPPLFYQGADEVTGEKLSLVSDEVLKIKQVLMEKYPGLDLSSTTHVRDWMLRSYGDDIGDKTNIYTMLQTNKGYRGLCHPVLPIETAEGKKFVPNFEYRYFSEDLPYGLCVTRGIAELAGVPTPHMDEVILWCQSAMNKEYLVDNKLCGKDLNATRAPQHYGVHDLDTFMKQNQYVSA